MTWVYQHSLLIWSAVTIVVLVLLAVQSTDWQVRLCDRIDAVVGWFADTGGWLFIVTIAVICWDVFSRKLLSYGINLQIFGSTVLQELEWHFHAVLFSMWLGYTYIKNGHVRIDVLTGGLSRRNAARLEVVCGLLFAIPYCIVVADFSIDFAVRSFLQGETSDAPTGLPYRFIVKTFLSFGLLLLFVSVISVLLRRWAFLRGHEAALPVAAKPGH